jgi:hypothetical protein
VKSSGNITTEPGLVVAGLPAPVLGLDGSGLAGAGLDVTGAADEGPAAVDGAGDAVRSVGEEHPAATTPSTTSRKAD